MLDPEVPDERRDQIVAEARARIGSGGTTKPDPAGGTGKMAFEIRRRTEADYRFSRFESTPPLLESLDHELKIADGVLRFRIFGVDPRSPVVVPPAPTPGGATSGGPRRSDSDGEEAAPAEAPEEQAPGAAAEEAPAAAAEEARAAAAEEAPAEAAPAEPDPGAEPVEPPAPTADEGQPIGEEAPAEPETAPVEPETPPEAPETPPSESA